MAADNARVALYLAIQGMKDSVLGLNKIIELDRVQRGITKEESSLTGPNSCTLAMRRVGKMKPQAREPKEIEEQRILYRIIQCMAWNGGVFWLSILVFNYLLVPSLKFLNQQLIFGDSSETHSVVWRWMAPLLSWIFSTLWIIPIFLLSKLMNSWWFQDIADQAYKSSRGRPQTFPSLSKTVADILFSLLLQSFFLIQGMLISLLPLPAIGHIVSTIHLCMLYSLYAFEYSWFNRGWEVHKRLAYIESAWPYFLGFGFPLAFLTSMPTSYIVSGCVFSSLFPLFIVSANEADTSDITFEYPLKLFGIVIHMSNAVFRISLKTHSGASANATPVKRVHMANKNK